MSSSFSRRADAPFNDVQVAGDAMTEIETDTATAGTMATMASSVTIVGAGHAAGELAIALRQAGYQGPVRLIGDEGYLPYQRPPLSKAFLSGKVDVAGQRAKPSRTLRVGESLQVSRGDERFDVVVRGLSDSRGPAPQAQALYEETAESKARREEQRRQRAAMRDGYKPPGHRPDKRARRLIQALGDIDSS